MSNNDQKTKPAYRSGRELKNRKTERGFTVIELLVSVGILSIMLVLLLGFVFGIVNSNDKTKADRYAVNNARRAMDVMTYEIKHATSVYTPTTTQNQLSLETTNYLPEYETTSYVDFFLCGTSLCMKKESQDPIAITSDTVEISDVTFTQLTNGSYPSVNIAMTVQYGSGADQFHTSSITLNSTASLRNY
jgi:prepilin-type N-terminal cleavage/methylation domain-containing protein